MSPQGEKVISSENSSHSYAPSQQQSSSTISFYEETSSVGETPNYFEALTKEELADAKKVAEEYYSDITVEVVGMTPAPNDYAVYQNSIREAHYEAGNIIVFEVDAILHGETDKRSVSVARESSAEPWQVVNEGHGLNYSLTSSAE